MAAPATVDEFLDLIRRSGVSDDKRFDAHVQRLRQAGGTPADPNKFAGLLIRDGFLTQFQAEQLLQGKWRRFTIGKYKVLERLGSGGMGAVYLCEHKLMRRRVAVKVLPTAKAQDPSSLERFYREARAVAALDHPNIVHAYDIDQDESLHFLVMEYVDGASLQEIIKRSGPMNVVRACHYIRQAALGLEHAHEAGLVHRDIKPGNILVERTGVVKILDMGLARFFNDEEDILTKKYDENVLGTADYLAPEQALDSHGVDIRADIYSLGATFYFMLTGKTPFGEGTVAQKLIWHQTRHPKPVQEVRPDVPPGLAAIINKMMAKDPTHRYQVPGEIEKALAIFTQTPIAPPPDVEMPRLSLAATGAGPPDTSPDTVVRPTTPSIGAASVRPPPSRPSVSPTPASRSVPPVAQPIPRAVVATAVSPETEEAPPWHQLDEDTHVVAAHADTASDSKRRRKNLTEELFQAQKSRVRMVVILCAIPIVAIILVLAAMYAFRPTPEKKAPGAKEIPRREKLIVKKGVARTDAAFPTLKAALDAARKGETIELLDEVLEENIDIRGHGSRRLPPNVIIQPAVGKKVLWKSASKDPKDPILRVYGVNALTIRGRGLTFDGTMKDGVVEDLLQVHGDCPALTIQDVSFRNVGRGAIALFSAKGADKEPISVTGIRVIGPAKQSPGGAIIMDALKDADVRHIVIEEDCMFYGFPSGKAVVPLRSAAVDPKTVHVLAK